MWGPEPLLQHKNFFGIIILQFMGWPMVGMGFDLFVIVPLLLSYCDFSFVLGCGVSFFGGFQHPPVNGCSKSSCDFGGLAGDECTAFYSALLNQSEYFIHFNV